MRYCIPFIIVLLIFSSCKQTEVSRQQNQSNAPIPVRLATINYDTINSVIEVTGVLSTEQETRLSFKTGGVIDRVLVEEGQFVKKGQLLASIKSTEIDAQVEQVELTYQKAKREYQRTVNLYLDKVATLEQLQNSKTGIDMATQTLQQASFNRQYATIYATTDGFVIKKFLNSGEIAAPGLPVLVIRSVSANSKWVMRLSVSDKQWTSIAIGNTAFVTIDAFRIRTFHGVVSKKSFAADPATGSFLVEVQVNMDSVKPAVGMFGTARIAPTKITMGYAIPYDAILDANNSKGFVFVSDDRQHVQKVPVNINSIGKDQLYITDGLKDHRYLVVSGSPYLKHGSLIKQVE